MLRNATSRRTGLRALQMRHRLASEARRAYAAPSDKKRALSAQQIKGSGAQKPPAEKSKFAPPADSGEGASNAAASSGMGFGKVLALSAVVGFTGASYYYGVPGGMPGAKEEKPAPVKEAKIKEAPKEKPKESPKKEAPAPEAPVTVAKKLTSTKADKSLAKVAQEEVALSKKEVEEFNEIIADVLNEAAGEVEGVQEAVAAIAEEEKKTKAAAKEMAKAAKVAAEATSKAKKKAKAVKAKEPEAATSEEAPIATNATIVTSSIDESKIMAEIQELKKELHQRSDTALEQAHTELAKLGTYKVTSGSLDDLDKMTQAQLKVRLVQMARDLEERTKWEAVRLQEFLNMKEKEVEDKYLLILKKLRLEAEQLQESKLTEQRKVLTAQAEEALKEQQTRSDAFLENSMQIQEKSHADDKLAFEQTTKEAMDAKYEELLGNELAKVKEEFATKMRQRVNQMEELTKKLTELEISLKTSQSFQTNSLEAHRITAAAIALMEKLESGEPAGAAVRALEAVASDNAIVSAAVHMLPASVSISGVPSLQELQTSFDETIYPQCRKAANVPVGLDGLEGQLLGSVFSFLRFPPGPEEAAPEAEKDSPEFVLARIKRYVQLGELEQALTESKKLDGQVAYTAKDWETQARDRVAVEKAVKVIRMECALANESLASA